MAYERYGILMFNRFKKTLIFAGILSLCVTLLANADTTANVKKTLQALYKAQDTAVTHKDAAGFFKDVAPDATFTASNGQTATLKQFRDGMAGIFSRPVKLT